MSNAEPLRICIVTDAYLPCIGGVENHVLHLSGELTRLGHEITVVTHAVPPNAPNLEHQVESPAPVHRLPGALLVVREHDIAIDPRMVGAFRRLLRTGGDRGQSLDVAEGPAKGQFPVSRFDIVHGQSEGSYLVFEALAAARRRGIPTVLTRHSVIRTKPALARFLLLPLTQLLSRRADGVIAVSRACADESGRFPGALRVIPNGVDTAAFRPMPEERQRRRREIGYSDDDVVIGFIGRLHTTKGVPLLLDGFRRLRAENPRLRLLLAGPGPLRHAIEERAKASSGAITLMRPQPFDRVPALLNALDLFAFPSRGEAFGISLLEAMACGLPSVALGKWGVKEFVDDGETGLLADSPAEFYDKLSLLASDAALRSAIGSAARRAVEARYSWPAVAAETVAFYRQLLADRGSLVGDTADAGVTEQF